MFLFCTIQLPVCAGQVQLCNALRRESQLQRASCVSVSLLLAFFQGSAGVDQEDRAKQKCTVPQTQVCKNSLVGLRLAKNSLGSTSKSLGMTIGTLISNAATWCFRASAGVQTSLITSVIAGTHGLMLQL